MSIVTSGGSAFHNISWRHTATTPGTGLLLARSVAGPKVGDYTHDTGLLLSRDTGMRGWVTETGNGVGRIKWR